MAEKNSATPGGVDGIKPGGSGANGSKTGDNGENPGGNAIENGGGVLGGNNAGDRSGGTGDAPKPARVREISGDLKPAEAKKPETRKAAPKKIPEYVASDSVLILIAQILFWLSLTRPQIMRPAWEVDRGEIELLADPLTSYINKMIDRLPEKAKQSMSAVNDLIGIIVGFISLAMSIREREHELVVKSAAPRGFPSGVGSPSGIEFGGVAGENGAGGANSKNSAASADGRSPSPVPADPRIINIAVREGIAN